jgi:addiction module HigA family antidote
MKMHRTPSHPGMILKRLYLDTLGVSVVELARALAVSRKSVSQLVNGRGRITAQMALRLSIALKTTPQLWLNLQQNYDLWHLQRTVPGLKKVRPLAA